MLRTIDRMTIFLITLNLFLSVIIVATQTVTTGTVLSNADMIGRTTALFNPLLPLATAAEDTLPPSGPPADSSWFNKIKAVGSSLIEAVLNIALMVANIIIVLGYAILSLIGADIIIALSSGTAYVPIVIIVVLYGILFFKVICNILLGYSIYSFIYNRFG